MSALLSKLFSRRNSALVLAFVIGIAFWGGFNWSVELSNQEAFCISCHEMRDNVYREYQQTVHYSNRTGVRAVCADCHVPKVWAHKIKRKIAAVNELFYWAIGSIDTAEKFADRRMAMAEKVWATMQANDSLECRNCHELQHMENAMQRDESSAAHREAQQQGQTCIDCHQGIAHQLPEEFLEKQHLRYEQEKVPCWRCHTDMPHANDW